MLSYALIGKRWTAVYVLVDALVDFPQFVVQSSGTAAVASAPPAGIVAVLQSPDNPFRVFLSAHVYFFVGTLLVLIVIEVVMVRTFGFQMWRLVKRIRARIPPHLWARPAS